MSRPYRVLHLIKSLGRGGAETLLKEGQKYSGNSFQYAYGYFLPWKDALVSSLREAHAEVICFKSKHFGGMLLNVPRVSRFIKEWEADLVHCHMPLAGVIGRIAGRLQRIPVVYTEHNVMERYHPWTRRMNLLTWSLQSLVVAVSSEVESSIQSNAKKSVAVRVVQNGIPVDSFHPSDQERNTIRTQMSIPLDAFVIGNVAVFRPQKDLQNWIRAARTIRDRIPSAHFLLVGDGVMMPQVRSITSQLGLDGVVHFAGLQQDVRPYFSAMDLYMSSSIFEGLPLALLEAMAMRLPVVATSVGGVPEVVQMEKTGLLVPPGDAENLARQVNHLFSKGEQARRDLGIAGRRIVEERFGMKRMISELESIYLEVLQRRPIAG
jgi:glycosyltransferase involved in cell wall biosynthesis